MSVYVIIKVRVIEQNHLDCRIGGSTPTGVNLTFSLYSAFFTRRESSQIKGHIGDTDKWSLLASCPPIIFFPAGHMHSSHRAEFKEHYVALTRHLSNALFLSLSLTLLSSTTRKCHLVGTGRCCKVERLYRPVTRRCTLTIGGDVSIYCHLLLS